MSGIIGVVNRDGRPVDRRLLERLTASMAFRGPDAQASHIDGAVGLGHALLQTEDKDAPDIQPFTLDGQVWITADARIDDRSRLLDELKATATPGTPSAAADTASDAELVLRAYLAWGDDCTSHLLGDFVWAIWDGRRQRLLCARDQVGPKPFFYAEVSSGIVFGNTLASVRQHPEVSGALDDRFIADFLLFGQTRDTDATSFSAVRRLPPAHTLEWTGQGVRVRRYWMMPLREPVYCRDPREYVDRFGALLRSAVSDRLRTRKAAVMMSGGLDSTSVAATAHKVLSEGGGAFDLRAFTVVSDSEIRDEERRYATVVATALGIPIRYEVVERSRLFDRREHRFVSGPEPRSLSGAARQVDRYEEMAAFSRVFLTGHGGDAYLHPSAASLKELVGHVGLVQFLRDTLAHARRHGRMPRLGIRTRLREAMGKRPEIPPMPDWIDEELVRRLDLRSRWKSVHDKVPEPVEHHRPEAYRAMTAPWHRMFETLDPGVTGFPIEARHPLFDLRLVDFALTVPSMPWCADKALVREAMRGMLPDEVRLRRKTPFAGDPDPHQLPDASGSWLFDAPLLPTTLSYLNRNEIDSYQLNPGRVGPNRAFFFVFYMNFWLAHVDTVNLSG